MFKSWSESNEEAKKFLKPDLGLRDWNSLSKDDKYLIWKHLELNLFNRKGYYGWSGYSDKNENYFEFYEPNVYKKQNRITQSIEDMVQNYKFKNYGKNYIESNTIYSACEDFILIFDEGEGNVVLELLSYYCRALIKEYQDEYFREKNIDETETAYFKEKNNAICVNFDEIAKDLNEVFTQFRLNVHLTRSGFIPRQDAEINKKIVEPVLQFLSDAKWKSVNNLLADAFIKYRENTPSGYSSCVTHTVAAVEAFLQIKVRGVVGEGDFSTLVSEGQRKGVIPSDLFTREIFKTIISILMRERKETGDAHVKKFYATENNAKMVLNLSMVFLQHCMVN